MTNGRKPRVAILGGGAGALTAAAYLSAPGWRDRFDSITVYQMGWRLGGKGASGRGEHDRIEEHGLHIWLGFYDNAFRLLNTCYEELGRRRGTPLATIAEAFEPANLFAAMEDRPAGWIPWIADFPMNHLRPWDPGPRHLPTMWEYFERGVSLALELVSSLGPRPAPAGGAPGLELRRTAPVGSGGGLSFQPHRPQRGPAIADALLSTAVDAWGRLTSTLPLAADVALVAALELVEALGPDVGQHDPSLLGTLLRLLDAAGRSIQQTFEDAAARSDPARRSCYMVDLLLACARGILRHGLLTDSDGFDAVDHYDFVEWLELNGAAEESARCTLIRTIVYDMAFAYKDGDPGQPSCSAATALRGLARMFATYRGSIAWKMRAGMGDVVFAPMYQALSRRGVRFEFFHRVEALRLSADKRRIAAIEMGRQADLVRPQDGYEPLRMVRGVPCWPARPDVRQLVGVSPAVDPDDFESFWSTRPDAGRVRLLDGQDFDVAVLGISIGALPYLCEELIEHDPRWAVMTDQMKSVQTQVFQLWLKASMEELSGEPEQSTLGGYVEPFDTYADMRQLIERESWGRQVRSIVYFCNTMPTPKGSLDPTDGDFPRREKAQVYDNARRFLMDDIAPLWPRGVYRYPTEFRWDWLAGSVGLTGSDRLKSQYWRANVNPSDRYVLSIPGTARFRLHPGDSGFDNLFLAGDWTQCGLNAGCVEAAVMSGMLAANAIWGIPPLEEVVGLDHP